MRRPASSGRRPGRTLRAQLLVLVAGAGLGCAGSETGVTAEQAGVQVSPQLEAASTEQAASTEHAVSTEQSVAGATVVSAREGQAGHAAGVREGDLVVRWCCAASEEDSESSPAKVAVSSPLELYEVEMEHAATQRVTLTVRRDSRDLDIELSLAAWGLQFAPAWARAERDDLETLLSSLGEADAADGSEQAAGETAGAGLSADALAERVAGMVERAAPERGVRSSLDLSWALNEASRQSRTTDPERSRTLFERARAVASSVDAHYIGAQLAVGRGIALHRSRDFAESNALLENAAQELGALEERAAVTQARALYFLGQNALFTGRLDDAQGLYGRCLQSVEHLPPTRARAACIDRQGQVAFMRGHLDEAEELFAQGLEIREQLVPGGFEVAGSLNGLGVVATRRGDLAGAQDLFERVLEVRQRMFPDGEDVGQTLLNLGVVAAERGDLGLAERRYLESLAIQEKINPDDVFASYPLNNLANVTRGKGEYERSRGFAERALEIRARVAPGSRLEATSLFGLATTLEALEQFSEAESAVRRALQITTDTAPGSQLEAHMRGQLAEMLTRTDAGSAEARALLEQAISTYERVSPRAHHLALARANLAAVVAAQGDADAALQLALNADELADAVAPATVVQAEVKHTVGVLHRDAGRSDEALRYFEAAVQAIEQQRGRLDMDERGSSQYRARYQVLYDSLLDAQVEVDDLRAAVETLERGRARALVAMLASRDLVFRDLPQDLDRQMRTAISEYERVRAREDSAPDIEQWMQAARDRARIEERLAALEKSVETALPHYAALTDPRPPDYAEMVAALEPGTVVLMYVVQPEQTRGFAMDGAGRLETFVVGTTRDRLESEVDIFRTLLLAGQGQLARTEDVVGQAGSLYRELVQPAEGLLQSAERVLISPDGPLNVLPWSALWSVPDESAQGGRFLLERFPMHTVASMSVYEAVRRERSERNSAAESPPASRQAAQVPGSRGEPKSPAVSSVVVFADPAPPRALESVRTEPGPASEVLTRTPSTARLRGSRMEANALRGLFARDAEVFTGRGASEARVRQLPDRLGILHFATHAFVDDRLPLESGLVLAGESLSSSDEDGVLRAWEVLEGVRIDADLVTLSGCDTGLGQLVTGEGVVGLTRAFQYAGARSVIASLWPVSDRSTAALMERFYRNLAAGDSKDEALREAQLELMRSGAAAPVGIGVLSRVREVLFGADDSARQPLHPYHWAGFQLHGDWR